MSHAELAPWMARMSFQLDDAGRSRLYRTLAMLLDNRVLLAEALREMWGVHSDDGKKPNVVMARFLMDARDAVDEGRSLSTAIRRWASAEEAALLSSAERTGDWRGALDDAMRLIAAKRGILSAVVGGMAYPLMLFATLAFVLHIIAHKLAPAIAAALPGAEWTGVTWLMFVVADMATRFGVWFLIAASVLGTAVLISLPRLTGNWRYRLERIPPYSIYRVMQGAPFMIAIAVMLRARIKLLDALNLLGDHASAYMRERIDAIRRGIARGDNLGVAMADADYDFPDKEAIRFIRLLASRDGFDGALLNYAEDWMANAVSRVQMTMRVVGIVAMLAVAGVIGMVTTASFAIQNTIQASG